MTAYVRNASKMPEYDDATIVEGDIFDKDEVKCALEGQDAVMGCVGIPMKCKLPNHDSLEGHKVLLEAMHETGAMHLVDWDRPSIRFAADKIFFYHRGARHTRRHCPHRCEERNGRHRRFAREVRP